MKYSIDLQSPFAFSAYWYAAAAGLIALSILLRFFFNRLFAVEVSSPFRLDKLHRDCAGRISKIEKAYKAGEMKSRDVHQQMSREVRSFIQKVTGMKAETMVYEDLAGSGRPELAELIREYYEPEFARSSGADTSLSLEKGRALVDSVYQRALREQWIDRHAARQGTINNYLNIVMRVTPRLLRKSLLKKIRLNSLTWMERIELAFIGGNLDPYSVNEHINKAVRSYVYAATGAPTEEAAYEAMCAARPTEERIGLQKYLREFYEPASPDCTPEDARRKIKKGKELVKR